MEAAYSQRVADMMAQLYTLGDDILLKKLKEASEIKYEAGAIKTLPRYSTGQRK